MTSSLLSLLGSSKSKQSQQFDPAKQAHTGKVWACHERRNRNVGNCVYPARGSLGGHMASPTSAECSLTVLRCSFQSQVPALYYYFFPFGRSFLGVPQTFLFFPTYSYIAHTSASVHHKHDIWTTASHHKFQYQIKFSKITGIPDTRTCQACTLLLYSSK